MKLRDLLLLNMNCRNIMVCLNENVVECLQQHCFLYENVMKWAQTVPVQYLQQLLLEMHLYMHTSYSFFCPTARDFKKQKKHCNYHAVEGKKRVDENIMKKHDKKTLFPS